MTDWLRRSQISRCRRCAVYAVRRLVPLAALTLAACSDNQPQASPVLSFEPRQSQLAQEIARAEPSEPSRMARRFYQGYLAEILRGDLTAARLAYQDVVAQAGQIDPEIAARAALRLAEIEFLAGRRREAFELTARAWALGSDHLEIVERASRLQTRLGSLRSDGSDVRGPPIGTEPGAISPAARERFARAEELLRAYHRIRLEPRLERLRAGVRSKENAMEAAQTAYRAVLALGEPAAVIAAELRSGSLYHDLALSLMFDLPPELEPRARARLRRLLRTSALAHLRRARAAYERCLEAAKTARDAASEHWAIAADLGLRSVADLLRGR